MPDDNKSPEKKEEEKSFWKTLPGILTGIAAVLTALAGLVAALNTAGVFSPKAGAPLTPTTAAPVTGSCLSGYVWREINPSDRVCVTPESRAQAQADNAAAASRREAGAFGPNTCKQGFVWREAFAGDLVCVTPDVRTQTANDNAAASSRTVR